MTGIDVAAAAQRLRGVVHRTPVMRSRTLDTRCGCEVFVKCENLQRMGAFKIRGAYNLLATLSPDVLARGAVAFSSGNHAQGVALAARLLGTHATIVMPADAPAAKLAATREYGAEVVTYRRGAEDREAIASEIAHRTGATVVPPFDHERIVEGAGTVAYELLEEIEALDAIVVPVGGGGLLAGTLMAAQVMGRDVRAIGVEPEAGDDFAQSLRAGRRVTIAVPPTIADGLQTTSPGEIPFAIAREYGATVVTVEDAALLEAMRWCFERMKLITEPSGVAGLAALLRGRLPQLADRRVGVVVTGGNVDAVRYGHAITPPSPP